MSIKSNYLFKEIDTMEELAPFLSMRYQVFKENPSNQIHVVSNLMGLDVNEYDVYSRHYGLYFTVPNFEIPVGYIRCIQHEETEIGLKIKSKYCVVSEILGTSFQRKINLPYPTMKYFPNGEDIINYIEKNSDKLVEASRLTLIKEHRSKGVAQFLVEAIMAKYYFDLEFTDSIISCHASLERFYRQFSYKKAPGSSVENIRAGELNYPSIILVNHKYELPESLTKRLNSAANIFKQFGCITFNPNNPKDFIVPAYKIVMA